MEDIKFIIRIPDRAVTRHIPIDIQSQSYNHRRNQRVREMLFDDTEDDEEMLYRRRVEQLRQQLGLEPEIQLDRASENERLNRHLDTLTETLLGRRPDQKVYQDPDQKVDEQPNQPKLHLDQILISADASKNMCRICLSRDKKLSQIKYPGLYQLIRALTEKEPDPMLTFYHSGFACAECNVLLDAFAEFRSDARLANHNLLSAIRYVAGIAPDPETW